MSFALNFIWAQLELKLAWKVFIMNKLNKRQTQVIHKVQALLDLEKIKLNFQVRHYLGV